MSRVYLCPLCGGTELRWAYPRQGIVCCSCMTPFSKWKIYTETSEILVQRKDPEPLPDQVLVENFGPIEKFPFEEYHDETIKEMESKELEIPPETEREPQPEIREDLLPVDFDEIISIDKLVWDPYNPRQEEPLDDLVESIRKTGFAEAIIVHPSCDGKFFVTDGWQRAQAGVMAGWRQIPCKIYATSLEALEETDRRGIKREWTKFQRIKFYRNLYDACRNDDMNHQEALRRITKRTPAIEQRILSYLSVTRLPPLVQTLLKEPKNRTTEEWDRLEKIYYTIRLKRKTLNIGQANAIAKYLRRFPQEKQVRAAIGVLGLTITETIRKIRVISKYPEEDPLEIIRQVDTGYGLDEILDVGLITVDTQLKHYLQEYCAMRRIPLKEFMTDLLTEWWIREKIGNSLELEVIGLQIKMRGIK